MKRFFYGAHEDQFADLYRPKSLKILPVMLILHGGYWKDNHTLNTYATRAIVDHYAQLGQIAIWNLEYRRMEFEGKNVNAPWPAILNDAAEGIDFLKEQPVSLVVLDMVMPQGIGGCQTYEMMAEIQPGQKAVIASGYSQLRDVKRAQKLGAGRDIKKPYTLKKLGLAVRAELADGTKGTDAPVG